MGSLNLKKEARLKRKKRIRKKILGTPDRPRLTVFRSARHIYAQVIDDTSGRTLAAACSLERAAKDRTDSLTQQIDTLNKEKGELQRSNNQLQSEVRN